MMQPNPIQRFLGLPRGADSPFELLGLRATTCDERAIREALRSRLDRVRRHPESLSHEADEVRLALHAAAAQLLDADVRAHLAAGADAEAQGTVTQVDGRQSAFRLMATHVLANAGGWNRDSQRWLAMLAHAHGLDDRQLHQELRAIAAPRGRAGSAAASRAGAEPPREALRRAPTVYEQIRGVRQRPRRITTGVSLWLIGAVALIAVVSGVLLLREAAPKSAETEPVEVASPIERIDAPRVERAEAVLPDATDRAESVVEQIATPEVVLRWLEQAHEEFGTDPGHAAWRFERAVEALSRIWPDMNAAARTRANSTVLTFAHRIDIRSIPGRRAMNAIERGAHELLSVPGVREEQVFAAVWAGSILTVLRNDTNADEPVRRRAHDVLLALGGSQAPSARMIDSAMYEVLPLISAHLVQRMDRNTQSVHESAWAAWLRCLEEYKASIEPAAPSRRTDLLAMRAAEALLLADIDVASDVRGRDALYALLHSAQWSPQPEPPVAWELLLAWFDDAAIATSDLAVVTEWVVDRSGASGVGPQMKLSRGSINEARQTLRDRYARLWNAGAAGASDGFAAVWSRTARETLSGMQSRSLSDRLQHAALLSRLNAAAALRWRGETDRANIVLMDPMSPVTQALRATGSPMGSVRDAGNGADGLWAARFLSSNERDIESRTTLLAELGRRHGELGPIDADVLAETALRSPANELRTRAQEVVRRGAAEPAIISSLLEVISLAPDNESTRALIADVTGARLPALSEADWEFAVRLALVERLLSMLAPRDDLAGADALSAVIMDAYAARVNGSSSSSRQDAFGLEQSDSARGAESQDSPHQLWRQWLADARALAPNPRAPVQIEDIARRCDGRLRLARGPMQQFAALQWSVAEAMAFVITAERPSRAPAVHDVVRYFASERRAAPTIVDQIVAAEQAMLAMWAIRFGVAVDEALPQWTPGAETETPASSDIGGVNLAELDQNWLDSLPIHNARERLVALTHDSPLAAFELAEEFASESMTPQGLALARRLFALAYAWDEASETPRGLGASVCLALAELSRRDDERRWLLALAVSLDPSLSRTIALPDADRADAAARLALAQGLELYRRGDYREALELLQRPEPLRMLESFGAMLTGGANTIFAELTSRPSCRECRNRRVITDERDPQSVRLCPTCDGDPGPDLPDAMLVEHLRLERLSLSDEPQSWSAALLATRGAAMRDVDPAELARTGR